MYDVVALVRCIKAHEGAKSKNFCIATQLNRVAYYDVTCRLLLCSFHFCECFSLTKCNKCVLFASTCILWRCHLKYKSHVTRFKICQKSKRILCRTTV